MSFGALPILNRKLTREEQEPEPSWESAERAGEGGFLYHHLQGIVLQNKVVWEGADRPGDCVGLEGTDSFSVSLYESGETMPSTM